MIFCNHRVMSTIVNVWIFMNWPHFACNINYWSRNNLMQSFLLFVTWFLIARSFPLMDFMRSIVVDMNSKLLFYYNNSPLLRFIQIIRDDFDFFFLPSIDFECHSKASCIRDKRFCWTHINTAEMYLFNLDFSYYKLFL